MKRLRLLPVSIAVLIMLALTVSQAVFGGTSIAQAATTNHVKSTPNAANFYTCSSPYKPTISNPSTANSNGTTTFHITATGDVQCSPDIVLIKLTVYIYVGNTQLGYCSNVAYSYVSVSCSLDYTVPSNGATYTFTTTGVYTVSP